MAKKILAGSGITLLLFLGFVTTRKSEFHYERSGIIQAPAEKIFPFLCDFRKGMLWNPFAQKDPKMKVSFTGPEAGVGAVMEFDGNADAGSGKLEILKSNLNEFVELKLTMTKPFAAENLIRYTLSTDGSGTKFSWSMQGDGGFLGKLISVFIDCDKMISSEFEKGIAQLKNLIEKGA